METYDNGVKRLKKASRGAIAEDMIGVDLLAAICFVLCKDGHSDYQCKSCNGPKMEYEKVCGECA